MHEVVTSGGDSGSSDGIRMDRDDGGGDDGGGNGGVGGDGDR